MADIKQNWLLLQKFSEMTVRRAYLDGDPNPLAALVRDGDMLDGTREFIASIIEGKIKKWRGPKDKRFTSQGAIRKWQIKRGYKIQFLEHKLEIAAERNRAALHLAKLPSNTPMPFLNDLGNPVRLPIPKGWKNTGGSAKERTLVSLGEKHNLSPERISEIVYPRKRDKL